MNYFDILLAKKLSGGGGSPIDLKEITITENGTVVAPSGEAYNKIITNVPLPANAYLNKALTGLPADIATFNDGEAMPLSNLKIGIEAVQSGSGDPSPTNIRPISGWSSVNVAVEGKNKLHVTAQTDTINGITFTVNSDGSIKATGTATATAIFQLLDGYAVDTYTEITNFGLKYDTNYILSGCPENGDYSTYRLILRSGGSAGNITDIGNGASFNIDSQGSTLRWMPCIVISSGYACPTDGLIFKPMIRYAIDLEPIFAPYVNGNTYTIALGDTYYGGYIDWANNNLVVTNKVVDMGSLSWANRTNNIFSTKLNNAPQGNSFSVICERYKTNNVDAGTLATLDYTLSTYPSYDYKTVMIRDSNYSTDTDFKNSLDGVQLVYELATPITIPLQLPQVKTREGVNNLFADCGQVQELSYFSK